MGKISINLLKRIYYLNAMLIIVFLKASDKEGLVEGYVSVDAYIYAD